MSVAGIMVLIAVSLGVLTFIMWPFITQPAVNAGSQPGDNVQDNRSAVTPLAAKWAVLQSAYDQTLITVRDLDFDFQTGKLLADDHDRQRAALMVTAADLLRRIDLLKADTVEAAVSQRRNSRAAQQAETAIAQKRARAKKDVQP